MSCLAQVFPSSAVSVGMTPSNRTLEAGNEHVDEESRFGVTSEQFPVADDPFTACTPSVEKLKCNGITICIVGPAILFRHNFENNRPL